MLISKARNWNINPNSPEAIIAKQIKAWGEDFIQCVNTKIKIQFSDDPSYFSGHTTDWTNFQNFIWIFLYPLFKFLCHHPGSHHPAALALPALAADPAGHHHDLPAHLPLLDLPLSVRRPPRHDTLPPGVGRRHWRHGLSMETSFQHSDENNFSEQRKWKIAKNELLICLVVYHILYILKS